MVTIDGLDIKRGRLVERRRGRLRGGRTALDSLCNGFKWIIRRRLGSLRGGRTAFGELCNGFKYLTRVQLGRMPSGRAARDKLCNEFGCIGHGSRLSLASIISDDNDFNMWRRGARSKSTTPTHRRARKE